MLANIWYLVLFLFLINSKRLIDYLLVLYLQRSIEDKLTNLKKEKQNIKEEIDRITPEFLKVIPCAGCHPRLVCCAVILEQLFHCFHLLAV